MRWRALAALAACAVLGACYFTSETPFFPDARGACPFPGQTFETLQADPEAGRLPAGAPRPVLRFEADDAHCIATREDAAEEPLRLLFVPMGRSAWIVQSETDRVYFIARTRGSELKFYFPDCDHFSAGRLRRLGVVTEDGAGRETCRANDPSQIETLFRSWRGASSGSHGPAQIYRRLPAP
ncbi:MAG: hypothetical protein GC189_04835 [Alphaproteobacteria bacterium]|nr:hypothetical protein [Alphaproteobacteria bacterium]